MVANVDFKFTISKTIKGGETLFSIVFIPDLTDIKWIRKHHMVLEIDFHFLVDEDDAKDEIGGKYGVSILP